MEGVEDIPGSALSDGIRWSWESFPEYLDALESLPRSVEVAAQVPHGAVRAYVMGERGGRNEPARADDVARMARSRAICPPAPRAWCSAPTATGRRWWRARSPSTGAATRERGRAG